MHLRISIIIGLLSAGVSLSSAQTAAWMLGPAKSATYTDGTVGIGTTSPQAKLHVFDPAVSATSTIETGGGVNAWSKQRFKKMPRALGISARLAVLTAMNFSSIGSVAM